MATAVRPPRDQPLVVANRWDVLQVPRLGAWTPTKSVTVVVPAHDARHLPKTLAGLAAQTYPDHLLDVVVVDDGSDPPAVLPDVRPRRTRLVATRDGWGRAATCHTGAEVSDGEVIHWLDADMVPDRHEVEAQMRWHHVIDYAVVLGHKTFADDTALDHVPPSRLRRALLDGAPAEELAHGPFGPHAWVEAHLVATHDLLEAGPRAMRVHVGATASVTRSLYEDSGGMPVGLPLGEDIVLGYRLREAGAVFIPDRESRGLHLGSSTVCRRADAVNRHNQPYFADHMPDFRRLRIAAPRSYAVPYVEVVVPVEGHRFEHVRAAVDQLLSGAVPDLVITLVADWSSLTDGRRRTLDEEHLDLRLARAAYGSEPRVRFAEAAAERSAATFRLTLPDPSRFPVGRSLRDLLHDVEADDVGSVRWRAVGQPDVVLTRTCAAARDARCAAAPGEGGSYAARIVSVDDVPLGSAHDPPPLRRPKGVPARMAGVGVPSRA